MPINWWSWNKTITGKPVKPMNRWRIIASLTFIYALNIIFAFKFQNLTWLSYSFYTFFSWFSVILVSLAIIQVYVLMRKQAKDGEEYKQYKRNLKMFAWGLVVLFGILTVIMLMHSVAYADRAKMQCGTYCNSIEDFLYSERHYEKGNYQCDCIKSLGEPDERIVGSRMINASKLSSDDVIILLTKKETDAVVLNDIYLRTFAGKIIKNKGCPSGDKECAVDAIYRYTTENMDYIYETARPTLFGYENTIQSPQQIIQIGGGNCEDFAVLANSLMENVGIETATILTPTHAYAAACNINSSKLKTYASKSLAEYQSSKGIKEAPQVIIKSYALNEYGVNCIAIDPTGGPLKYPGYDWNINSTKLIITNVGKEINDFGFVELLKERSTQRIID